MRLTSLFFLALILPLVTYASIININTADAAALDTLSGIGPSKAAAIIEYRTKHGPFKKTADIQKVSGIGPAIYTKIQASITVSDAPVATPVTAPQPSPAPASSNHVQAVEPISTVQKTVETHAGTDVSAPTAPAQSAAVGAALPLQVEPVPTESGGSGLLRSPWTLGLLGVVLVAGGAFIFL